MDVNTTQWLLLGSLQSAVTMNFRHNSTLQAPGAHGLTMQTVMGIERCRLKRCHIWQKKKAMRPNSGPLMSGISTIAYFTGGKRVSREKVEGNLFLRPVLKEAITCAIVKKF